MQSVASNTRLSSILQWCERQEASDLHVQPGKAMTVRIHGKLTRIPHNAFPPLSEEQMFNLLKDNFEAPICYAIRDRKEYDLSFYHGAERYRANFSKQRGVQSFSFRIVPQQRQNLADLRLPASLAEITNEPRGLVLVTGPTAQGKSTTARALLQHINETIPLRVITIEDPIEYVFEEDLCQFEQREVGIDTDSFVNGIRNAMRQDPNVIFLGEMRDRESIYAAMQAAETGHLVLATLHSDSTAQAIARIREFYPAGEQENISNLLARNINSVIAQRLLPSTDGNRVPCLELLKRDKGIQEAIRTNNLVLLTGSIEASVGQGMHSFDQYLIQLLAAGMVSDEVARHYAINKHRLEMVLRGIVSSTAILRPDPVS